MRRVPGIGHKAAIRQISASRILILLGLVLLGSGVLAWLVLPDACSNEVIAEQPSPDGQHTLATFVRNCGATTSYSTQVSVLRVGERLGNRPGNALVSDGNHGAAPEGPGGGPLVNGHWDGNNQLTISFHPATRVFKSEALVEGIAIRYVADPAVGN